MLEESDIDVVTHEVQNDTIDDSTIGKKVRLGIDTIWSSRGYSQIDNLLKQHKPDIVHFHNTFPLLSPSVYLACKRNGVPVVQTLHNFRILCPGALLQRNDKPCNDCLEGGLINSIRHRCYRGSILATLPLASMISYNRLVKNYQNVDIYIALTQFAKKKFEEGGIDPNKILVKPNFLPNPPGKLSDKSDYVVYVGRLSQEKGVATLVKSWSSLKEIPLVILGDGPLRADLENYCRENGIPVRFVGSVSRDEVIDIVSKAAFQIIPSEWYEGFPMVMLEAFATGTPVIASRIGSLDELIVDGKNGFKFEPGDIGDLQHKVRKLWGSKELMEELGTNAAHLFDSNYTQEKNLVQLLEIYGRLTHG